MRLTEIRVDNLLTFASLSLPIRPGMNIVVGPNGVGKSHIVRLIALCSEALTASMGIRTEELDIGRFLRVGSPSPSGSVAIGFECTLAFERTLMLAYVRAITVASMKRDAQVSHDVDSPFEVAATGWVKEHVTTESIAALLAPRLLLLLEGGLPPTWSLALEFDYESETYHIGLGGRSARAGYVEKGPFSPTQGTSWSVSPIGVDLTADQGSPSDFHLGMLLPASEQICSWQLQSHPHGQPYLLTQELVQFLGVSPGPTPDMRTVLRHIFTDRIVVTDNLRHPPRLTYPLGKLGIPPPLEDAGNVPLELYRRLVGDSQERDIYRAACHLFKELTDLTIALKVNTYGASAGDLGAKGSVKIIPSVEIPGGEVSVEMAGAGAWEGLVVSTLGAHVPGRVVVFDEVAHNLHPTRQARLLVHLKQLDQAILITHSPFLVPHRTAEDLLRVSRLYRGTDGTEAARVDSPMEPPDGWLARWQQLLATSADVRAALFGAGVVLVEGDADEGAFRRWFDDPAVANGLERTIDALNVIVLSVDGDKNFGAHVSLFERLHVPWVILCDGPVMSPAYERSLVNQLVEAGIILEGQPSGTEEHEFDTWRSYWRQHRVYTVADCFGGVTNEGDKRGEVEAFLKRVDGPLWQKFFNEHNTSKVRAAYAFAEALDLQEHPETLDQLRGLWSEMQEALGLGAAEPTGGPN